MASSSSHLNHLGATFHALQIKLETGKYLLWRHQIIPLLTLHKLLPHIDGTGTAPSPTVTSEGKSAPNPDYVTWLEDDNHAVVILQSSLTEESVAVIVGLTRAREIWLALEAAYGNTSVERVHHLRDMLRHVVKGDKTVAAYGREFKSICDQLAAVGHPMDRAEQNHLFVTGLGPEFLSFSSTANALHPNASLSDLLSRAESHEILARSIASHSPSVAFTAQSAPLPSVVQPHSMVVTAAQSPATATPNRNNNNRNYRNNGKFNYKGNRNSDPCQWCGIHGHKANVCRKLQRHLTAAAAGSKLKGSSHSANSAVIDEEVLAKAFTAQCNTNLSDADWYVDSGASDHMSGMTNYLHNVRPKTGNSEVTFGNGQTLPVTHKGDVLLPNNVLLKDILVVPNIHKNLLSVSMLTKTNNVDVLFSHPSFYIQDRMTKKMLAQGRCEDGLYVLDNTNNNNKALVATRSSPMASFEEWHARLGHVSFESIMFLKQLGVISLSSILPKPGICSPCQMAKAHKLPFNKDEKRAQNPLDLIHCDLWGPSPVTSRNNYRYYAAFIDDSSRFCWIYPLRLKSEFFEALNIFLKFVQTQFERKVKVFQSDGGTEFTNQKVQKLFENNGTFHRFSCPYTPQQNGRVERKHRHIVETGLAMLFHSKLNPNLWVEAFSTAVFIINRLPSKLLNGSSPFEILYKTKPDYNSFKPFGCRVYPLLRSYSEHKLSPRSVPCIFLGYSSKHKGYKCFEPTSSRTFITRHAKFDELSFPSNPLSVDKSQSQLSLSTFLHCTKKSHPTVSSNQNKSTCPSEAQTTQAQQPHKPTSTNQSDHPHGSSSTHPTSAHNTPPISPLSTQSQTQNTTSIPQVPDQNSNPSHCSICSDLNIPQDVFPNQSDLSTPSTPSASSESSHSSTHRPLPHLRPPSLLRHLHLHLLFHIPCKPVQKAASLNQNTKPI
ncbi:hypothetical protein SSX86_033117 [Deinandra increscens subsp. villosa]|uniref:Integrase catalytic domain-containing protein n=1 Tax=Deinandra increscens subsp. villosa TaxID=3103831 RepID=A0AAP0C2I5_9ASTR